jgi:hypothetical protein
VAGQPRYFSHTHNVILNFGWGSRVLFQINKMPSSKKIDLNEALEDSPQIQLMVNSMEGAVGPLKDFISQLKETCQTLHLNQMKVAESVSAFASVLGSADDKVKNIISDDIYN